jgi:hypothetical protein
VFVVIKLSDVSEICTRLKNNKACGHDNISYEHIKYGGKLLIKHLCYLFNLSLQFAYIPNDWRKSIIILLYKGDNKPRTDTNSYQDISLVPSALIAVCRRRKDVPKMVIPYIADIIWISKNTISFL